METGGSGTSAGRRSWRWSLAVVGVSVAAASAVALLLGWGLALEREVAFMGGIFVLAALLWSTVAVPLATTSLLVIGLQALLLANPGGWPGLGFSPGQQGPSVRQVIAAAADPVLLLFFGGLLLARAAQAHAVDTAISRLVLAHLGHRPAALLLALMGVTALFSMWMSNTATTAMMMAIVAPLLAALPAQDRFRVAVALAIPFAANIGGMGTPIGSPPNAVAVGYLRKAGLEVGFPQWMLMAIPLMTGLLLLTWALLRTAYPPSDPQRRLDVPAGRLPRRGRFVVACFVVTVALWLSEPWHGVPAALVALVPVIVLSGSGVLSRRDLNQIDWDVLILIAGGISLGAGLQMTRLDALLAGYLPTGAPRLVLAALVVAAAGLSAFMSNTAAANLLLPVAISFAVAAGAAGGEWAVVLAVSVALASSVAMPLPVSTPPNAIAYAHGYFSLRQMAILGTLIGAVAVTLIVLLGAAVIGFWHRLLNP